MTGGEPLAHATAPDGGGLYYVYGIVPPGTDVVGAPAGIEGAAVTTIGASALAALVSQLDAQAYSPELIEERVGDVEWLAPRAEAHDAVLSWAGHPGPVVPLHMWAMFSGRDSVLAMLESRATELVPLLERLRGADEYGLRVYADPAALERLAAGDASVAELERSAAAAGPGQRYLIERKLEGARRDAARALASSRADDIHAALRAQSVAAARDAIPTAASDGSAVLSAAFLVRRDSLDAFRAALTAVVRQTEAEGFRFAFTGPWPPYHFAAGSSA